MVMGWVTITCTLHGRGQDAFRSLHVSGLGRHSNRHRRGCIIYLFLFSILGMEIPMDEVYYLKFDPSIPPTTGI